jgi:hypothetical protein
LPIFDPSRLACGRTPGPVADAFKVAVFSFVDVPVKKETPQNTRAERPDT